MTSEPTPWRAVLAETVDHIARVIERLPPEAQYRAARDAAQDLVYQTAVPLRREFGRVFDPLVDGPDR